MRHLIVGLAAIVLACLPCLAQVRPTDDPTLETAPVVDHEAPLSETPSTLDSKPRDEGLWAADPGKFFSGAFVALLGHESGHLIANSAVGSSVHLKSVNYGPVPFFTIEPNQRLSRREHGITAAAGFNAQNLVNEYVLLKRPNLRREDDAFLKGMVTFNFWLSVGYAATAFAGTGPAERDTKGMADALGWNEKWVGAMILVPTALDTYRYKHPEAKWAKTASWVSKLLMIGITARARD